MDGPRRRLCRHLAALLLAGTAATACSEGQEPDAPGPTPASPSRTSAADEADDPPRSTEPLVLAVHATRTPPRLSPAEARRVVRGDVRSWRPLDGTAARLRVVDGRGSPGAARRALRAVTRDPAALAVLPGSAVRPWVRAAVVGG